MPQKSIRLRLPPEQRKAQLLECAIAATAEHGVARVTHAHVARLANVSVAAVHSYFRTREDLVADILATVDSRLLTLANAALDGQTEPRGALFSWAHTMNNISRTEPALIKVWLDWSTGFRAEVWRRYLLTQEKMQSTVRRVLEDGQRQGLLPDYVDISVAAQLFIGGGHTMSLARFAGASEEELELLLTCLVESVLALSATMPARQRALA